MGLEIAVCVLISLISSSIRLEELKLLKKIRKLLKQQEGFTLVELMIVVVILGILSGIGVQQYANVQQRAKDAADDANRKVLTNATNMWLILGPGLDEEDVDDEGVYKVQESDLWPQYLDEWPVNPLTEEKYTVTVTVTTAEDPTTGDLQYSIEVGTEPKSEDNPG
jgi:prepilin-type N-terminal cleavage/methylation domain-containing protein